ncbi:MAG: hypothetical protein Q4A24_00125 [Akkermansia sp.]|nr:hypothetical protein [Akkermansia sp.]MDO4750482.1 hypothetical protein [Akkermansia sp.]
MKQYMMRLAAVAVLGLGVMAGQSEAAAVAVNVGHGKVSVVVKDKDAKRAYGGKKQVNNRKKDCHQCRHEDFRRHDRKDFRKRHDHKRRDRRGRR